MVGVVLVIFLVFFGFRFFGYGSNYMMGAKFFGAEPEKKEAVVTISRNQALSKVRLRAEVVKYEFDLTKAGKKVTFEVEDGDKEWVVHVFEIVVQGEGSHTATFGWYAVDKISGEVRKDI